MSVKIYLAGGFCQTENDWRHNIVNGLNSTPPMVPWNTYEKWGVLQNAILGCFDFIGPYPVALHDDLHWISQAIEDADIVFGWADNLLSSEVAKLSVELALASSQKKLTGVGSTGEGNESWNDIWIAHNICSFFPFGYFADDPKTSLVLCIRDLLSFLPLEKQISLWKQQNTRRFFDRNLNRAGYVYIIQADTGHCKIGRTNSIPNRMKLFNVKLPFNFEIINYFPCDDMYEVEDYLHTVFMEKRINGEWFTLTAKEIETLASIGHVDRLEICDKDGCPMILEISNNHQQRSHPWYTEEELELIRH